MRGRSVEKRKGILGLERGTLTAIFPVIIFNAVWGGAAMIWYGPCLTKMIYKDFTRFFEKFPPVLNVPNPYTEH